MYDKQKYILLKELKDKLILEELKSNHAIIAGGAIRAIFAKEQISDYDIYFKTRTDLNNFLYFLDENDYQKKFETECAKSYDVDGIKVQIIIMSDLICPAIDIINQFDYTICMGAYDFDTDEFVLYEDFLEHLAMRELYYNTRGKYPLASLFRLKKYMKKGYNISGVEIIKLGLSINELHMQSYLDLKVQLQGIDTLFLMALTEKLLSSEYAERDYDFNTFLELIDQHYANEMESVFE